jgi:glycosyltransferase involved in cell wall biosynthesis
MDGAEAQNIPLLSIAIPCYEMHGRGAEFLEFGLQRIAAQTYPRIEVVVTDHSADDSILAVCTRWADRLYVRHHRNERKRGSSSANINAGISLADGELIKVLCQDDFLTHPDAAAQTVAAFSSPSAFWLISSYETTHDRSERGERHTPRINGDIASVNTLGTHSALTIRKVDEPELFDENLIWFMDCEYYRRLYDRFGPPVILEDVTVTQYLWGGQVTNTYASSRSLREAERGYVVKKHPLPIRGLPRADRRLRLGPSLRALLGAQRLKGD